MSVTFTNNEKRLLELPQDFNENHLPEAIALRKIIDQFPFMLEVAEYKFDPIISKIILHREGQYLQAQTVADGAIAAYLKSKEPP